MDSAPLMDLMESEQDVLASAPVAGLSVPGVSGGRPIAKSGQALFAGVPAFVEGEATLFNTSWDEDAAKLPSNVRLTGLTVRFPGGNPDPDTLDPDLTLLLFVDDLTVPRARVRLVDLLRQGGTRPLNVQRQAGQAIRITLIDKSGITTALPIIEVALQW